MRTVCELMLLFLAATVLHWILTSLLGSWGQNLNFMLLFAAAACVFVKPEYGYPTAFLCGLFLDFFGVKLFGHYALIFTLCAAVIYSLEDRLDFDAVVPQMVCIFVLETAAALGNLILLKMLAGFSAWNGFFPFVGGIAVCTLLAPGVFWAVRRVFTYKIITYSSDAIH